MRLSSQVRDCAGLVRHSTGQKFARSPIQRRASISLQRVREFSPERTFARRGRCAAWARTRSTCAAPSRRAPPPRRPAPATSGCRARPFRPPASAARMAPHASWCTTLTERVVVGQPPEPLISSSCSTAAGSALPVLRLAVGHGRLGRPDRDGSADTPSPLPASTNAGAVRLPGGERVDARRAASASPPGGAVAR